MDKILTDNEIADQLVADLIEDKKSIILYNDDVNSFDHVIECLIKYCNHSNQQAEQCALIIDSKGKYAVKSGTISKLIPIYSALTMNNLTAEIE
jgi:ATP-dependent Clp protease adaptor protein ClpS